MKVNIGPRKMPPRTPRSQMTLRSRAHVKSTIKKPVKKATVIQSERLSERPISFDDLQPETLNKDCRELFVGYFLQNTQTKFDQIYVDTKNDVFVAPETSMLHFQRLFMMNVYFNRAVHCYFQRLHYHFSITSRPFDKWDLSGANRMHNGALNVSPLPVLGEHKSVVVFRNGHLLHLFKESNFFNLKRQGLFRPGALSLTFDGTDTTKVPTKFNLFSDLKLLNFQAPGDMSGVFQRLLNESFVSLRELSFCHPNFMSKLSGKTSFPPNLHLLRGTTSAWTILDSNAKLYKKLLSVEVSHLDVDLGLLVRLNKLSSEPFLLNPKIEQLSLHWSFWPEEIEQILSKLLVNVPSLKIIRFRKRDLKELHVTRYAFGGRRYFATKNLQNNFFSSHNFEQALQDLQEIVRNEDQFFGQTFPFKIIFDQGLFLFGRQNEDKVPSSKNPINIQISLGVSSDTKIQLLEDGHSTGPSTNLIIDSCLETNVRRAMRELWPQLCRNNEVAQFDPPEDFNQFMRQRI